MKAFANTYFMLLVTGFTFFGLSSIQSVSFFSDFFGESKIVIELNSEEENEVTVEIKVIEGELVERRNGWSLFQCDQLNFLAFHRAKSIFPAHYLEVSTPPPEFKSA
jgi:hypothetical protein